MLAISSTLFVRLRRFNAPRASLNKINVHCAKELAPSYLLDSFEALFSCLLFPTLQRIDATKLLILLFCFSIERDERKMLINLGLQQKKNINFT